MADDDDEDDDDDDEDEDDAPSIAPFASRSVDPSVRPSSSEVTKVKIHAERLASLHCVTLRSQHCRKRGDDEEARDGNGKKMKVRGATSSSSRTLDVRARAFGRDTEERNKPIQRMDGSARRRMTDEREPAALRCTGENVD